MDVVAFRVRDLVRSSIAFYSDLEIDIICTVPTPAVVLVAERVIVANIKVAIS
jgi:hypothetical protein